MKRDCLPCSGEVGSGGTAEAPDRFWLWIGLAAVFAGQGMMFGLGVNLAPPTYGSSTYWILHGALAGSALIVFLILGPRLLRESRMAWRGGRLTVEALFLVSLIGAVLASLIATMTGDGAVYYEVVAVVLAVYSVGKRLSDIAKGKVFSAVNRLRSQYDLVRREIGPGGETEEIHIEQIARGERVRVLAGEVIPVDGSVIEGVAQVEEAALTGEPTPVVVRPGSQVLAGGHSLDGALTVLVEHDGRARKIDAILRAVEQAPNSPSQLQEEADRMMKWFFPLVMLVCVGTILGWGVWGTVGWAKSIFFGMAVLLVACPCALGLATPIAVWGGLQRMAAKGLVSERASVLDAFSRCREIFFDKTGTLSEPDPVVVDAFFDPELEQELLGALRLVESSWNHPVARAICQYLDRRARGSGLGTERQEDGWRLRETRLLPGLGVEGILEAIHQGENGSARQVRMVVGSRDLIDSWMDVDGPQFLEGRWEKADGRDVYVGWGGKVGGVMRVRESLRPGASEVLSTIRAMGVNPRIISGDQAPEWLEIRGVKVEAGLSAEEKVALVRASREAGKHPLMVGDGLNDAAAMAAASGSISVKSGVDLTRARADAVLVSDRWEVIPEMLEVSRRAFSVIRGNLRFALVYNAIGMSLAASGQLHPVVAALLMVVSSFVVSARAIQSVEPP
ncbi:MAG: heavy metal translocating P-type ATPase [Puniceicoccaceae bacterium]